MVIEDYHSPIQAVDVERCALEHDPVAPLGAREGGIREVGAREAGAREAGIREVGIREAGTREAGAVHNTKDLGCGRVLDRFPKIVIRLRQILEQFLNNVYCMDATFISDDTLDQLPTPSQVGKTRVGGIDMNKPRTRTVLGAALALACSPKGFTVRQFADVVRSMRKTTVPDYDPRRATYDLKKLRSKDLLIKAVNSRRYQVPPPAVRMIAALVILREKILRPILRSEEHTSELQS